MATDDTAKSPSEIQKSAWARTKEGKIDVRLAFAGPGGSVEAVQVAMPSKVAIALGERMCEVAAMSEHSDPRKFGPILSLNTTTRAAPYLPMKRCIYCGSTKHSDDREVLGEEHIIPLSIDGELTLPEASCKDCEDHINKNFEQFCNKKTFGPIRYYLDMTSRRPKERPTSFQLGAKTASGEVSIDVPRLAAPALLLMPLLKLPGVCIDADQSKPQPIQTGMLWHKILAPTDSGWIHENKIERIETTESHVAFDKFALLLAKIAHAYVCAERQSDPQFRSPLADIILGRPSAHQISYLIGGETDPLPASSALHEIELLRRQTAKHNLLIVRIRLFARLEAPTYYVVAGLEPRQSRR